MVVLDAALHVLQLVQHRKHVDELAQGEQVGLGHKVLPPLGVAQALDLAAEALYGFSLQRGKKKEEGLSEIPCAIEVEARGRVQDFTWKYMNFMSLVTSGSSTSTVFS